MWHSSGLWNGQNLWETPRCSTEDWVWILQQSAPPKLGFTLWLLWASYFMIFCSCTKENYIWFVFILFVINWYSWTNLFFFKCVGEYQQNVTSVKIWKFDTNKLDTEPNRADRSWSLVWQTLLLPDIVASCSHIVWRVGWAERKTIWKSIRATTYLSLGNC